MKKLGKLFAAIWFCMLAVLLLPGKAEAAQEQVALDGIYIENINVSGMTEAEITDALYQKLVEYQQATVLLYVNGTPVSVTAGEMGLNFTNPEVAAQAVTLGKQGNVLQRFRTEQHLKKNGSIFLGMNLAVSQEAVQNVIEQKCVPLNCPAVDMGLARSSDGSFYTTDKRDGMAVRGEESAAKVVNYMNTEWHGGLGGISLEVDVVPAQGDAAQLALVQDVLGTGSTVYDTSVVNRCVNIEVGTAKLNGILLYPGQELSVCDALVPFTADAGYMPAPSIETGAIVDTYGGGICQVSTTLFRAVLEAELEVTERSSHSLIVGYVEPSMDAAIAEGIKDLKFVNNTDAPIYIEGYAGGGEIHFAIYGHETRDPARSITFVSNTLETIDATTEFELDDTQAFGTFTAEAGHQGSTAEVWKIVTINGEEQSREQILYSEYKMTPNTYIIGTKGISTKALQEVSKAISTGDPAKVQMAIASAGQ